MKRTIVSRSNESENSFELAFKFLEAGIQALMDGPWHKGNIPKIISASSDSVSDYSPTPSFSDAKVAFSRSDPYSVAILISHKIDFEVSTQWVKRHVDWLNIIIPTVRKWCDMVYDDLEASQSDWDLAYSTYDSFVAAVNRLKLVLDGVKNKEIAIAWQDGIAPNPWPVIGVPEVLNRKFVSK
jgi:hypothetical protein